MSCRSMRDIGSSRAMILRKPKSARDAARIFPARDAFKLYDTFGLPLDFMRTRPRSRHRLRSGRLRRRHGGAAQARAGFLEGRRESHGQSRFISRCRHRVRGLSARRSPPDAKCWPSSRSHDGQRRRRAGAEARRARRDRPRPHALLRRCRRTGRRCRLALRPTITTPWSPRSKA